MGNKKALVVDNDFFFVEFFTELLEKREFVVSKAYDGKEGIALLNEGLVDLLFVDFVMPKIDGRQLINYARLKFPDSPFPIVAVSGTIIEQLEDLHKIGADYYVAKGPLDVMAQQLNEFLDLMEKDPKSLSSGKRVLDTGMVFPRREAVDLLDSLHFQECILESAGVGIVTIDKDKTVLNANSLALAIMGKSSLDVVNKKVGGLFPPESARVLDESMDRLASKHEPERVLFNAKNDGKALCFVVSPFRIKGEYSGWVLVLVDEGE